MAIFEFRDNYRRLKTKAGDCGFNNEDTEIKTQINHRTRDARLRKKALREQMDLKALLELGKSLEIKDEQVRRLQNGTNSVSLMQNNTTKQPHNQSETIRTDDFRRAPNVSDSQQTNVEIVNVHFLIEMACSRAQQPARKK